ncbi:unnamed protein product [Closterium sp. NIES-53]
MKCIEQKLDTTPLSRPAATTAAAATAAAAAIAAAAGGGAVGSAESAAGAGGAGGAIGSAGGAACAGGARPTTDRQRATPHSSEFPPTTTPLQTLHMDVWGPAPVGGTDQEHYFLLVVDDYTRYATVFPLWHKADVSGVLIPWIRTTRCQLRERFRQDFPVLRLHSDRGGEFSSDLLADFCRDRGIVQSFTLPASPQQNGIAERRIVLIMEVARTSMIHAAAPHFLWPFVVRYAVHHLNLWPHVSEPETLPTLWWTGKVGDA